MKSHCVLFNKSFVLLLTYLVLPRTPSCLFHVASQRCMMPLFFTTIRQMGSMAPDHVADAFSYYFGTRVWWWQIQKWSAVFQQLLFFWRCEQDYWLLTSHKELNKKICLFWLHRYFCLCVFGYIPRGIKYFLVCLWHWLGFVLGLKCYISKWFGVFLEYIIFVECAHG